MSTTITMDGAGRIVLPKPVRDELQLAPGDTLQLETSNDRIVLCPVRGTAGMRKKKGLWVFRTGDQISTASVNEVLQDLRRARELSALHPEEAKPSKRRRKE